MSSDIPIPYCTRRSATESDKKVFQGCVTTFLATSTDHSNQELPFLLDSEICTMIDNFSSATSGGGGGRSRKTSASDGQSAEEFFIDVILQRHARKLLSQGQK